MTPTTWTPDRIDRVRRLAALRYTASRIAAAIGGCSRNAVIGMMKRKGIQSKNTSGWASATIARDRSKPKAKPAAPASAPTFWTDDRIDELRRLVETGQSATQIAAQMGRDPSTIRYWMDKLGIKSKWTRPARSEPQPPYAPPADRARIAGRAYGKPPAHGPGPAHEALTASHCKWPLGEPAGPDFHFCSAPRPAGQPYCPEHARLAYRPVP